MFTVEMMYAIIEFFWGASEDTFVDVFGERLGVHLWDKYENKYAMDALQFVRYLDGVRFEQLVNAINASRSDVQTAGECGFKPTPENLTGIVAKHGADLLEWPTAARSWLVTSEDAGEWFEEHMPGLRDVLADAVGRWHHMAFLGLAERDGSYEYFPF